MKKKKKKGCFLAGPEAGKEKKRGERLRSRKQEGNGGTIEKA